MNYELLRDLADVQTGITLRGPDTSRHDPTGTHRLIRIGDVSPEGIISAKSSSRIKVTAKDAERFELKPGNLLVAARGSRLTAAVFGGDEPAVAGSQFIVIRILQKSLGLSSGYLSWYLNLPSIQEELATSMRGSYIRSLPARVLSQLQVPVPAIAKQQAIAELSHLRIQEKALMNQLSHKRSLLIDQLATLSINHNPHLHHVLS